MCCSDLHSACAMCKSFITLLKAAPPPISFCIKNHLVTTVRNFGSFQTAACPTLHRCILPSGYIHSPTFNLSQNPLHSYWNHHKPLIVSCLVSSFLIGSLPPVKFFLCNPHTDTTVISNTNLMLFSC